MELMHFLVDRSADVLAWVVDHWVPIIAVWALVEVIALRAAVRDIQTKNHALLTEIYYPKRAGPP